MTADLIGRLHGVNTYYTIQNPAEGVYKEKGSKFLAFAYPVRSESDIKEKIASLKKIYFDANHYCFAWILGPDKGKFRSFDDGEPRHSAGDPILNQIRSKGITDVLIVVVRYFGGVKLGMPGLTGAYKLAAENALANAVIVACQVTEIMNLSFDYLTTSDVMRLVKDFDLEILQQDFEINTRIKVLLPLQNKEKLLQRLLHIKAMGKGVEWQLET